MRTFTICYRLVFGLLGLAAVTVGFTDRVIDAHASAVNYFSFFTILSNVGAFAVLLGAAVPGALTRRKAWEYVRGAVTVYMVITGIVYNLLLAQYAVDVPAWVNDLEHRILPIAVMLDWLLFPPPRGWISKAKAMWWLVFPILYLIYSEVRGPSAHWYPYPFLDPRQHGVVHVVVNVIGIAAAFVLASLVVAWAGDVLARRKEPATL